MNRPTNRRPAGGDLARGLCMFVLLTILCGGIALASGPASPEKLGRQIGMMERTIDRFLVDSPNFLVTSGKNACGFYFADYGVVFTFNAQINDNWNWGGDWFFGPGSHITVTTEDGERQIIIKKNGGKHWDIKRLVGDDEDEDEDVTIDTVKLYERGKEELVEMLLDEGENLGAIPGGQYVMIAARMNDDDLKHEKKITRLTLKAKIDDLKAYGDDKLSETEMKSRIVIEEN
jgi:hypothetical protein